MLVELTTYKRPMGPLYLLPPRQEHPIYFNKKINSFVLNHQREYDLWMEEIAQYHTHYHWSFTLILNDIEIRNTQRLYRITNAYYQESTNDISRIH